MSSENDHALLTEFAPTGVLRVALNYGNPILVGRTARGKPYGISVAIANVLAERLGVDPFFVEYDRAADVSSDADQCKWDVCFLAHDPKRAHTIDFTKPYLQLKGSYLAGPALTASSAEDLIASGVPIGSVEGSAYTLTLQRKLASEQLVLFKNFQTLVRALEDGRVAAIAGIHTVMSAQAERQPGARVLCPPFMEIRQAIGVPQGRSRAKASLEGWLSLLCRNGTLGRILDEHSISRSLMIS